MSRPRRGPADVRYICVPVTIWDALLLRGIATPEPGAMALYTYLATCPESLRVPGVIRAGKAALAEALRWELDAFMRAFSVLEGAKLATADWAARIVYLPEPMQWDCSRPQSPSSATLWRREVALLPQCSLALTIDASIRSLLGQMSTAFLKSYDTGMRSDLYTSRVSARSAQGASASEGEGVGAGAREGEGARAREGNQADARQPAEQPAHQSTRQPAKKASAAPPQLDGQVSLALAGEKNRKEKNTETPTKPKPSPLPYGVDEMLQALASTSGRFVATTPTKGQTINAQKLMKQCRIEDVRLAGEWLAAGGEHWRTHLDTRHLSNLPAWITHAKMWRASGNPPLDRRRPTGGEKWVEPMGAVAEAHDADLDAVISHGSGK